MIFTSKSIIVHFFGTIVPKKENSMLPTKFLTLQLSDDLRENILYSNPSIPFSICIDHFDDYFGMEWSSHWHDEYEFGLVLKGSVSFTLYAGGEESTNIIIEQGNAILINSGILHSAKALIPQTIMAGFVFSNAFFNIKPFEAVLYNLVQPLVDYKVSYITFMKEDTCASDILSTLENLCLISTDDLRYELHCMELIFRLWRLSLDYITQKQEIFQLNITDNSREQHLKIMVSYIHAHYSENISINDIAKYAGISRTECFRCFQSILRKTPIEYLTDYRLSIAGMLLSTTNRTLTDIYESCGFNSLSYFGKIFKEHYGISPKKFSVLSKTNRSFRD